MELTVGVNVCNYLAKIITDTFYICALGWMKFTRDLCEKVVPTIVQLQLLF